MTLVSQKDLLLSKLQELDVALQVMLRMRSEMYSIIAASLDREDSEGIGIPLTFYENGQIISWGDDSEHFAPATFQLLQQLWFAPSRTLSKEDIRQDVIGDGEASDNAIWIRIKNARTELLAVQFPYEITGIPRKGYKMIPLDCSCPK